MRFEPLDLPGAWRLELDRLSDERGWFARTFCAEELAAHGIDPTVVQENVSHTARRGTLRGMHLQSGSAGEGKHIRCTRGRVFDVLIDLRPQSPTHRRWVEVELAEGTHTTLYAPPGIAHGFLTLTDGVEIEYRMTAPYVAEAATGVRWDDPAFAIRWPADPVAMSDRDASWPDYRG
jgi:dTDP-4-dehydrorhamnose 3,5-epimerase